MNPTKKGGVGELLSLFPVLKLRLLEIIGDKAKTIPKIIRNCVLVFRFEFVLFSPK